MGRGHYLSTGVKWGDWGLARHRQALSCRGLPLVPLSLVAAAAFSAYAWFDQTSSSFWSGDTFPVACMCIWDLECF